MIPGDRLLYAVSARQEMSWHAFKRMFELLCAPALAKTTLGDVNFARYETARALDSLAHIELVFGPSSARLHTSPPALSLLPNAGFPVAVLCGARAPTTFDHLHSCVENSGLAIQLDISEQPDASHRFPTRISVISESTGDLAVFAHAAGLAFSPVPAAWAILNFAGSLGDYLNACQWSHTDELNWEEREFDAQSLRFAVTRSGGDLRLRRYTHPSRQYPIHYLWRGHEATRIDPDWARFVVLQDSVRNVLHYDHSSCSFVLPSTVPLPRLFSRALCLCSGLIPLIAPETAVADSPVSAPLYKVYQNIPREFAELVAHKLHQKLITTFTLLDFRHD